MFARIVNFNFVRAGMCALAVLVSEWLVFKLFGAFLSITGIWKLISLSALAFIDIALFLALVCTITVWFFTGGKLFDGVKPGALEGLLLGGVYLIAITIGSVLENFFWYLKYELGFVDYISVSAYPITDWLSVAIFIGIPVLIGSVLMYFRK